jgi:hypothetical protein
MKKNLLVFLVLITFSATAQNFTKNPNLSNAWHDWDNNGCTPEIGGAYPYTGSPYWFENTYGGPSTTNLVAQAGGGACLVQVLPLIKGVAYSINFKGTRRCEADNPDIPPTLSAVVRAMGTTSFTMYSEVIYTYSNTSFVWHNETQTFTFPIGALDNSVFFSLAGHNIISEFGPILDDITFTPVLPFTVNGPAVAPPNTGTNWAVDNLPATGVTYSWSFPGATPSSSTLANPTNIQWPTTGIKTVTCVLNNGVSDVVTVTKNINVGGTLAVNMLSFNASAKNNTSVDLKWITTDEINSDFFEVYRSKNATDWELVGKTNSVGVNGGTYSLTDIHPAAGINYYKLKQVDKGGAYKFSNVVKINLNAKNLDVTVYPTIVTSALNYIVESPKAEKLRVLVTDVSGKRIVSTVESFSSGATQKSINTSTLASGVYLLTIIDDSNTFKKSVTFKKN